MNKKRYQLLKNQAILVLQELDTVGGGGDIHQRNKLHWNIHYRLRRLKEEGEVILVREHSTAFYTLDGLEAKLVESKKFIAKIKGGIT